jgi:hypothetical protein
VVASPAQPMAFGAFRPCVCARRDKPLRSDHDCVGWAIGVASLSPPTYLHDGRVASAMLGNLFRALQCRLASRPKHLFRNAL